MGTLLKGVVKCLEPPCGQEKTRETIFFAKYAWFAHINESHAKNLRPKGLHFPHAEVGLPPQSHEIKATSSESLFSLPRPETRFPNMHGGQGPISPQV